MLYDISLFKTLSFKFFMYVFTNFVILYKKNNAKVNSMRNFSIIKSINFYLVILCKKEFLFILCTYLALTFIFAVLNVFLICSI